MIVVNRKTTKISLFIVIALMLCTIFSKTYVFSYISIFLWIICMLRIVMKYKIVLIKYFSFIFLANLSVFSVAICEFVQNLYLKELDSYSEFYGSLPLCVLTNYVFFLVLIYKEIEKPTLKDLSIKKERNVNIKKFLSNLRVITCFIFILYLVIFIKIAPYPAFLLNVDRMFYSANYAPGGIYRIIDHQAVLLVTFPILLFVKSEHSIKDKFLAILTITLYCLYFLWNGNKFGPFFTLFSLFLVFYSQQIVGLNKKIVRKIIFISLIAIITLLFVAVIIQTSISNIDAFSYLSQRLAQQGQLWWKTFGISTSMHPKEFINEIIAIIHGKVSTNECVGANYGIYKIMYLCAPKSLIDYKLSYGARYTQAGYACAYYYFGIFGAIFYSIFTALLVNKLVSSLLKSNLNGDYIKVLLLMRLYINANTAISMFLYYELLDLVSIISYCYLLMFFGKKLIFRKERLNKKIYENCNSK